MDERPSTTGSGAPLRIRSTSKHGGVEATRRSGSTGDRLHHTSSDFVRVWILLAVRPARGFDVLGRRPAPGWGFAAVVIRFVPTALIVLALYVRGQLPFYPPYFTFIPADRYLLFESLFLPLFGVATWLLMSATAHTARRLTGAASSFDVTLNVIGMGLLTPMVLVWTWDALMIALGTYTVVVMAVSHTLAQAWEGTVEAIGLRRLGGYSWAAAVSTSTAVNLLYIGLANVSIR